MPPTRSSRACGVGVGSGGWGGLGSRGVGVSECFDSRMIRVFEVGGRGQKGSGLGSEGGEGGWRLVKCEANVKQFVGAEG